MRNIEISMYERLGIISRRLLSGSSVSSKDYAIEFNISERNAERDFKDKLPKLLNTEILKNETTKKWYILKDMNSSLLSEDEELILNILLQSSKEHGTNIYNTTLGLINKFKDSIHSNIFFSKVDAESIDDIKKELIIIEKAIINLNIIECCYKNKQRKIEPLMIVSFDGFWYLLLRDTSDMLIKKYYFKNISNIKVKREKFEFKNEELMNKLSNAINAYFDVSKESFPVQLLIEKEISYIFKRKKFSNTQRIINRYDNGSIEIELLVTHEMEVLPLIQKFLPYIKVIEPSWLWKKIIVNVNTLE